MVHFTPLETPRLFLRHFRETDLSSLVAYRNDPDVARYQLWEHTDEGSLRTFIQEMQEIEFGIAGEWFQIAIELKETRQLVGDCALKIHVEDEHLGEIGYTLARNYQGCGFATEALTAVLDYVFLTVHLHRVCAFTDRRNSASISLLERLQFRRSERLYGISDLEQAHDNEYLYVMLQREWLINRNSDM